MYEMWGLLFLWGFKEVHVAKSRKYKGDIAFTNTATISIPNRFTNVGLCIWNYYSKASNMNANCIWREAIEGKLCLALLVPYMNTMKPASFAKEECNFSTCMSAIIYWVK